MAEVASPAGISVSLLSQVERGLVWPSFDSLFAIAVSLGSTPSELMHDGTPRSHVVRAGEGARVDLPESDIDHEVISPVSEDGFEVIRSTLGPRGVSVKEPTPHRGDRELVLLLEGTARIEVGQDTFDLAPGDAVTFDPRVPHRTVNLGDTPAILLFVTSTPVV